ncbi:MAG: glycine C-acetyltransferase [Pseudomonadota bacterium]|nr:glycine C-acetyltransferase [Pseudomonadota bacterium]
MDFYHDINTNLEDLKRQSLYKQEHCLQSPQSTTITTSAQTMINMCANNYLGFANHPQLLQTAQQALTDYGYGMASVRFICGTHAVHQQLEQALATFLQQQDAILYSSCFDANTGLFETILDARDAIISDELNHASIIDGVRLCKAKRLRYRNNDMDDLRSKLKSCQDARYRLIVSDGVFSMDGSLAQVANICTLAKEYNALTMIDDSHAVGVIGATGAGTCEGLPVDIITGTLGKALGGAMGGYVAARQELIAMLRQKSRPYLFSNSLAPVVVATSIQALKLLQQTPELRTNLMHKTTYLRHGLRQLGFEVLGDQHPIVPVLVRQATIAQQMASLLHKQGVYAVGFFYPVVPKDMARVRLQVSAAHSDAELEQVLEIFAHVGKQLQVIKRT